MLGLLSGSVSRHPTVVLDIGEHSIKCGIAGEAVPRRIVPTNYTLDMTSLAALAPPVKLSPTETPITIAGTHEWTQILAAVFTSVFAEHLLISPKDRFVAVAENLLWPLHFKRAVALALSHISVSAVAFFPAPSLPVYAIALPESAAPFPLPPAKPKTSAGSSFLASCSSSSFPTATAATAAAVPVPALISAAVTSPSCLVVDIGYRETRVLPVVHGAPALDALATAPVGVRHVAALLRALLLSPPGSAGAAALEGLSREQAVEASASVVAPYLLPPVTTPGAEDDDNDDDGDDCVGVRAVAAAWANCAAPATVLSVPVRWGWTSAPEPCTAQGLTLAIVAQADAAVAAVAAGHVAVASANAAATAAAAAAGGRPDFDVADAGGSGEHSLALAARALTPAVAEAIVRLIAARGAPSTAAAGAGSAAATESAAAGSLLQPDAVLRVHVPAHYPHSPLGLTVTFPVRLYVIAVHALFGLRYAPRLSLPTHGAATAVAAATAAAGGETASAAAAVAALTTAVTGLLAPKHTHTRVPAAAAAAFSSPGTVSMRPAVGSGAVPDAARPAAAESASALRSYLCRGGASVADAVAASLDRLSLEARPLCARHMVLVGGGAALAPWRMPAAASDPTIPAAAASVVAPAPPPLSQRVTSLLPALLLNALAHGHRDRCRTEKSPALWRPVRPRLVSPICHPLVAAWCGLSLLASLPLPPRLYIGLRPGAVPVDVEDVFGSDSDADGGGRGRGGRDEYGYGDSGSHDGWSDISSDEGATTAIAAAAAGAGAPGNSIGDAAAGDVAVGEGLGKRGSVDGGAGALSSVGDGAGAAGAEVGGSSVAEGSVAGGSLGDFSDDEYATIAAKIAEKTAKATARKLGAQAVGPRDWLWGHLAVVLRRQEEAMTREAKIARHRRAVHVRRVLRRQERAKTQAATADVTAAAAAAATPAAENK